MRVGGVRLAIVRAAGLLVIWAFERTGIEVPNEGVTWAGNCRRRFSIGIDSPRKSSLMRSVIKPPYSRNHARMRAASYLALLRGAAIEPFLGIVARANFALSCALTNDAWMNIGDPKSVRAEIPRRHLISSEPRNRGHGRFFAATINGALFSQT